MKGPQMALAAILFGALVHAGLFIAYQQPDWDKAWTDQGGYELLARGIVQTGRFTRYPDAPEFVAEALRTPGYPLFVAAVYVVFGESTMAVVATQAVVFAALCLLVYLIGTELAGERTALAAAALTAAYPMFPYFGALVLTELWTTFVLVSGIWCLLVAVRRRAWLAFAAAGLLIGWTSLTRPGFFLLPAFLCISAALDLAPAPRRRLMEWGLFFMAFAVVMVPWFAYNYRHFGIVALSAAGDLGRPVWEASWQGRWNGRTQAALTRLADQPISDHEATQQAAQLAADAGEDPAPMIEYVQQWRTIRRAWTTPTEPQERVRARMETTREYMRVGRDNISRDFGHYLRTRLVRAFPILWIGDVPIRYSDIDAAPPILIRAFWAVQAVVLLLAAFGAWRLWQQQGAVSATLLVMPLLYVTAVHVPILSEARQSLPVKPLVLTLAGVGLTALGTSIRKTPASP